MGIVSGRSVSPVEHEPGLFAVKLIDGSHGARRVALLRGWLAPGASHSPHTHDVEEVVTFLSGRGAVMLGEARFAVAEGDALLIPPHVVHSTTNDDPVHPLHFVAAFSDAVIRSYPAGRTTDVRTAAGARVANRMRWYLRKIGHRMLGTPR